jgi:hypothetical protein
MGTFKVVGVLAAALAISGLACGLSTKGYAQNPPPVKPPANVQSTGMPGPLTDSAVINARNAASATLTLLGPALVSKGHQSLGFTSVAEVNGATIGSPVQVAFVGLDRLAAYTAGQPPIELVQPLGGLIIPVLVGGTVRCAVLLKANGSTFTGVGVGEPQMTKLITDSMEAVAKAHGLSPDSLIVLKIPALFLTFIARSDNEQIWVTPVSDAPTYSMRAGEELNAQDVFVRLRPAAQNYHPSGLGAHKP